MFKSQAIEVAPFPPCGDGLMTLKRLHGGKTGQGPSLQ